MWRTPASRKGQHIINAARKLATEASPKQNVPPLIPQPPSKSGGVRALKFIGLSLPVAAGGVVGYAWYDLEFRKQIEDNIPYAKELFESILPKDQEKVPAAKNSSPESSLESASVLNAQEDAKKNAAVRTISKKIVSHFDTFSTAQCSTEKEPNNKEENNCKHEENKNVRANPDLYASYIQPSFSKASLYKIIQSEQDEEDDEDDDDDEDDEEEEEDNLQSVQKNGLETLSEKHSTKNIHNVIEDMETTLAKQVSAHRSNPFNILAVPEIIHSQKYQASESQNIGDLLINRDDATDKRTPEKGITTSLKETVSEKRSDKISPSAIVTQLERREDDEKSDNAALEVVIHKLATSSKNVIAEAVKAQTEVATCIRNQTKLLKQAMDDTSNIHTKDAQWEAVTVAYKERELAIIRANELLVESKKSVEKLRDILQEGKSNRVTQNNPAIYPAANQLNDFLNDLGAATSQVRQAEVEATVMQKYKDLVEKGKKQFQKEIESLIPPEKFAAGKKLSEKDLNELIGHAHRRIEQLQQQIAEQLSMERQRLTIALEAQRQEDVKKANIALSEERQFLQKEFEAEKSKMDVEYLEQVENEVRKQLARQSAAHSDHLRDALIAQQQALGADFKRKVHVRLLEERDKFHSDVAGWILRLKGIEAAVEARATSEKLARSAQDLWLACIALNSAIHGGDEEERQSKPLKNNIDVILEAGQKHPFVETMASAFPHTALVRGVSTEDELRQRFFRVSRICRRLGLVSASKTSMYKYLVSYLHSFVVLENVVATEEGEEIDLTTLDNFALLSHANYWMEKGNLDIAARFMIQLTGESRRAASDWIMEAQLLLETKQIANTLMAYASATGLANTF